uniref:Uncharacterized protein n=1 Tax=Coccidioides posadasii RMSCC 3488 TaxID=454284 RepID=A0A0J6F033_COCPO|nr:hypothetical protein CPAG_02566 [Coccidioides posadasii RMSCC 3488]
MADRKRFLSFLRTKGLQSLTERAGSAPMSTSLLTTKIVIEKHQTHSVLCTLMKLSVYLCFLLSAVYVAAGAIPKNKRDNEIKKTCEKKCREIHRERVSKCEGLKDGKDKCLKSAALLGSDKGQKQCVVPCVASIFWPHQGGLFADFYS